MFNTTVLRAFAKKLFRSEPVVEGVLPGANRAVFGSLSFYEGDDVRAELTRLAGLAFK